jgi:hypothetical protein
MNAIFGTFGENSVSLSNRFGSVLQARRCLLKKWKPLSNSGGLES